MKVCLEINGKSDTLFFTARGSITSRNTGFVALYHRAVRYCYHVLLFVITRSYLLSRALNFHACLLGCHSSRGYSAPPRGMGQVCVAGDFKTV